jgi:hypothetical protein
MDGKYATKLRESRAVEPVARLAEALGADLSAPKLVTGKVEQG